MNELVARTLTTRVVGGLVASAALAGCAAIFGFEDLQDRDGGVPVQPNDVLQPPVLDAGVPDATPPPSCSPLPLSPTADTVGELRLRRFAMRYVGFLEHEDGGAINQDFGLDLDNHVTTEADASVCGFDSRTVGRDGIATLLDNACGVDNIGIQVFRAVSVQGMANEESFDLEGAQRRIAQGLSGAVLQYDGLLDGAADKRIITASWIPTRLVLGDGDAGCGLRALQETPDGAVPVPFASSDRWCYDQNYKPGSIEALVGFGYSTAGTIVTKHRELLLPIVDATQRANFSYAHLHSITIHAQLQENADGGGAELRGIIGGYWKMSDLYRQLAIATGIACELPPPIGAKLDDLACLARESRVAEGEGSCDAFSFALPFTAYEVNELGSPIDLGDAGWDYLCPARGIDDCFVRSEAGAPPVDPPIDAGGD